MITTFKQIQKLIISSILLLSLMIAGCSTEQENSSEQRGIEAQNENSQNDIARRETETGDDETQEQINEALETLSAQGSYMSPGGRNDIRVNIEVDENNIIHSAIVEKVDVRSSNSNFWVDEYNKEISNELVGEPLETAQSPERVNGSSLTSIGFNEALEKIREERLQ